jgi:hypothetical protein
MLDVQSKQAAALLAAVQDLPPELRANIVNIITELVSAINQKTFSSTPTQIANASLNINQKVQEACAASATTPEAVDEGQSNIITLLKSTHFSRFPLFDKYTDLADEMAKVSGLQPNTLRGYISNYQRKGRALPPVAKTALKAAIQNLTEQAIQVKRLSEDEAKRIVKAVDHALDNEQYKMTSGKGRSVHLKEHSNGNPLVSDDSKVYCDTRGILIDKKDISTGLEIAVSTIIVDKCLKSPANH